MSREDRRTKRCQQKDRRREVLRPDFHSDEFESFRSLDFHHLRCSSISRTDLIEFLCPDRNLERNDESFDRCRDPRSTSFHSDLSAPNDDCVDSLRRHVHKPWSYSPQERSSIDNRWTRETDDENRLAILIEFHLNSIRHKVIFSIDSTWSANSNYSSEHIYSRFADDFLDIRCTLADSKIRRGIPLSFG